MINLTQLMIIKYDTNPDNCVLLIFQNNNRKERIKRGELKLPAAAGIGGTAMAGSATDCARPLQRQGEVIELPRPIHSHMHRVRTQYPHNHCSQLQREMEENRLSGERPRHYAHTHKLR